MNPLISAQQSAFFSQNGYIEFENLLSPEECEQIRNEAVKGKKKLTPEQLYIGGRDLWRQSNFLKTLLLSRRMGAIATGLCNKSPLRLGCDQWIPLECKWPSPAKGKDLLSFQGIALLYLIRISPAAEEEKILPTFRYEPGLIPLPASQGSALMVNPNLILNFPKMVLYSPTDLYLVAYTLTNAVYVHNLKDPSNAMLKQLGYNFGDKLKTEHHPLIV